MLKQPWHDEVKSGDLLIPDPLWNRTTATDKLKVPTEVLRVIKGTPSQSGILFRVQTVKGRIADLDAAWFISRKPKQEKEE